MIMKAKERPVLTGKAGMPDASEIRFLDRNLPSHPVMTVQRAARLLGVTAPTARKAIDLLETLDVLRETTGRQRDRVYAYHEYMRILTGD